MHECVSENERGIVFITFLLVLVLNDLVQ